MTLILIQKIAGLGILLALGWILGRKEILSRETTTQLARLIIDYTMAALFFVGALAMDLERFERWWVLIPAGFVMGLIGFSLALPVEGWAAPKEPQRGVFRFLVSVGNSSFLPVPLCWALWGADGALACLFYVLGNNLYIFSFGIGSLRRADGKKLEWKKVLLTLLHPQSLGFAAGLLLAALNTKLPEWVLDPLSSFGQATIPMAMVATGSILSQVHLGKDVLWRMQIPAAFLKLILLPLIVLLLLKAWQPGPLVAGVLLLQAAMPSLASSGIYAKRFGGDAAQAAAGSLVTTLLCPLFLPLWMGLL